MVDKKLAELVVKITHISGGVRKVQNRLEELGINKYSEMPASDSDKEIIYLQELYDELVRKAKNEPKLLTYTFFYNMLDAESCPINPMILDVEAKNISHAMQKIAASLSSEACSVDIWISPKQKAQYMRSSYDLNDINRKRIERKLPPLSPAQAATAAQQNNSGSDMAFWLITYAAIASSMSQPSQAHEPMVIDDRISPVDTSSPSSDSGSSFDSGSSGGFDSGSSF